MEDEAVALFFYNNKRKDKHMKTKFITLGYGILLATFSNIIEAESKDGDVQPFKKKKR